jgi:hypothetical protein
VTRDSFSLFDGLWNPLESRSNYSFVALLQTNSPAGVIIPTGSI